MSEFLSFTYWFNPRPEPLSGDQRDVLIIIAIIAIILGLLVATGISRSMLRLPRKFEYLSAWFFFSNALISLALVFFNYELTPYLRSYFWFPVWIVVAIIWAISLLGSLRNNKRRSIEHSNREKEIKKYLPS